MSIKYYKIFLGNVMNRKGEGMMPARFKFKPSTAAFLRHNPGQILQLENKHSKAVVRIK